MNDADIVEFRSRLTKIETNIHVIGDLIVTAIALVVGISVGEIVQNHATLHGYGWLATLAFGGTFVLVGAGLRSRFRE